MRPKSAYASDVNSMFFRSKHDTSKVDTITLGRPIRLEKMVDGAWVRTGQVGSVSYALKHMEAIGGHCRAVRKDVPVFEVREQVEA